MLSIKVCVVFFYIYMNHTLLLASLERLHDRITTLEQGVNGVHLGVRNGNPHNRLHNNSHGNPGWQDDSHGNPPYELHHIHAARDVVSAHTVVVNTVAEEIVNIAQSWVRNIEPHELMQIPTQVQKQALVGYIRRHNSDISKAELSAAVARHLTADSGFAGSAYFQGLIPLIRRLLDSAYVPQPQQQRRRR
jgi:hypothetical protein